MLRALECRNATKNLNARIPPACIAFKHACLHTMLAGVAHGAVGRLACLFPHCKHAPAEVRTWKCLRGGHRHDHTELPFDLH
eukprot:6207686-Pleurochrysis_carterae.AAC.2